MSKKNRLDQQYEETVCKACGAIARESYFVETWVCKRTNKLIEKKDVATVPYNSDQFDNPNGHELEK
jgi:transcription initiation factor TFIIIB Brf1 subunit/transcription initiation factor TFIIB